jgi:hypothetical protein
MSALQLSAVRDTSTVYFVIVESETAYSISLDPGSVITGVFTKVVPHSDEER